MCYKLINKIIICIGGGIAIGLTWWLCDGGTYKKASECPSYEIDWTIKDYKQRCLKKEAQEILLEHETINYKGRIYKLKCKSIGAGVYEIYKDLEVMK